MLGERKQIRDSVAAALATVYAGEIFTSRFVDARDVGEYVNVYFQSGEVNPADLVFSTSGVLVVGFHTKNYKDDDELDRIADSLFAALDSESIAPDVIRGLLPAGFEYGDEQEREFTSIFLRFTVEY